MRFVTAVVITTGLLTFSPGRQAHAQTDQAAGAKPASGVPKFDPARDAAKDISAAVADAKRTNRRVILDVGGEWCGWCHALDRYFVEHDDLRALRDQHYVWLKVNYSPENTNAVVLGRYPGINGYPHLFVLDQDGSLVQSQDTSPLEEGPSYNYDRMKAFLLKWKR
jgi:thiol:disulfide interchange protein